MQATRPATLDHAETPKPPPRDGSIVPGLAMAALLLGGLGVMLYASWREDHPLPETPDDVEPVLKVPGEIPKALKSSASR
jgi:hypothetical protein